MSLLWHRAFLDKEVITMKSVTTLIYVILGLILVITAVNGQLGVVLASLLSPHVVTTS